MICRANRRGESGESGFGIGDNRHCCDFDLVHFGRINVYMDYARVGRKLTDFARDTIIEAQPHAYEHVGHADSLVDMGGAMHSRHANAQRMSFREGTDTEQRGDHRDIDFLSKSAQFIICL